MAYSCIDLTSADGIATLTFNRPKALNALNSALLAELADPSARSARMNPSVS